MTEEILPRIYCLTCAKKYPAWDDFHKEHFLDEDYVVGDYEWHLIHGPFYPVHKVENEQFWNDRWVKRMIGNE